MYTSEILPMNCIKVKFKNGICFFLEAMRVVYAKCRSLLLVTSTDSLFFFMIDKTDNLL